MTLDSPAAPRRRVVARVVAWVFGAVLLLATLGAAWIGVRGYLAYQHLDSARAESDGATAVLSDPSKAADLITKISSETTAARELTSDVIWKAGERLPWVGPQLAAVSTVSRALDDVASHSLKPLASVASTFSLDGIRPKDGAIDLAPFAGLDTAAETGASGLGVAHADISAIDTAPLVKPLRTAVTDVSALLAQAQMAAETLQRTATLLPAMLGADGPRDYLIAFQNNAEWRSLGGIGGSMVLMHTDDGRVSLTAQASSSDIPVFSEPVIDLTDDEIRLFGTQPATFVQNITQIPDFTRGARIAQEMWKRETGTTVDGVIALDPVTLSYLLTATGPIKLPTGDQLSADNAVQLLLNEVYLRYEIPAAQDAFFASAASAVFDKLTSGDIDTTKFVAALSRAGAENRLLIWSSRPEEQGVLDGTTLQGDATQADAGTTNFGVFVNDATASKMNFYTELETQTAWCAADVAELHVTLRNNAPADAAGLPTYITGGGNHGVPPGDVETVTYIYLPEGSTVLAVDTAGSGDSAGHSQGTDADRQVLIWRTTMSPGNDVTVQVRVKTPHTPDIVTRQTPTIHAQKAPAVATACAPTG